MDQEEKKTGVAGKILKFVIFILLFVVLAAFILSPFKVDDQRMYQHVTNFYREKNGTLDAVYIGSSNVYPWYEPPVAWDKYGIRTYDFSVPGMPARALKYVTEEQAQTPIKLSLTKAELKPR